MSWLRQMGIYLLLLALSACAAGSGTSPDTSRFDPRLGQIIVDTDSGRTEQIFRQRLERLLARSGTVEPLYRLATQISTSYPTDAVDMTARVTLYDQKEGVDLLTISLKASASVGAVTSLFGSEEAKANARERLAAHLAEKTYQRLLLYFSQDAGSDGS